MHRRTDRFPECAGMRPEDGFMCELEFMLRRKSCRVGFPWATVAGPTADADDDNDDEDEVDEDHGGDDDGDGSRWRLLMAPTHVQPVYAGIKLTRCSFDVRETIGRSSKIYLNSANADDIIRLLFVLM